MFHLPENTHPSRLELLMLTTSGALPPAELRKQQPQQARFVLSSHTLKASTQPVMSTVSAPTPNLLAVYKHRSLHTPLSTLQLLLLAKRSPHQPPNNLRPLTLKDPRSFRPRLPPLFQTAGPIAHTPPPHTVLLNQMCLSPLPQLSLLKTLAKTQ